MKRELLITSWFLSAPGGCVGRDFWLLVSEGEANNLVDFMMDHHQIRILKLPLGRNHPDIELIPVHLTTAAHTEFPKVHLVPKHSGHA